MAGALAKYMAKKKAKKAVEGVGPDIPKVSKKDSLDPDANTAYEKEGKMSVDVPKGKKKRPYLDC